MFTVQIDIQYKLAVRDGFVEIPDKPDFRSKLTPDDVLSLISGSVRKRQAHTPRQINDQEWIELPAFDKFDGASQDFYQIIRDAALAATA